MSLFADKLCWQMHMALMVGSTCMYHAARAIALLLPQPPLYCSTTYVGYNSVEEYYAGSSSAKRIPRVRIPLLCIQALDDPIAPKEAIPYAALQANPYCTLVTTPCGGHLGWASGPGAPFAHPWTDGVMTEWLSAVHSELMKLKQAGTPVARAMSITSSAATYHLGELRNSTDGDDGGDDDAGSSDSAEQVQVEVLMDNQRQSVSAKSARV